MSRIRTIKPEILTDAKAIRLSDTAWRLWVSIWVIADDVGRFPADDVILAGQTFPGRDVSDVSGALTELSVRGFVTLYEVNGERFGVVPHFLRHQKINRPSGPKFPAPCGEFTDGSLNAHGGLYADRDRDRDRDRDHDHDHDHVSEGEPPVRFDFEAVYQLYPRKAGKAKGLEACRRKIRSPEAFEAFRAAVEKMAELWRDASKRQLSFCPYFSSWVNARGWEDDELPAPKVEGQGRMFDTTAPPREKLC